RAESAAAAAEQVDPLRSVPRAAGTLLTVHFLAGAIDLGAVLDRVSAGAALGELPDDAALDEVAARLETEDCVRHGDRAGRLAVEGGDFQFHVTHPPGPAPPLFVRPAQLRAQRRPPSGTCPAAALPWAAPSSRHRAP